VTFPDGLRALYRWSGGGADEGSAIMNNRNTLPLDQRDALRRRAEREGDVRQVRCARGRGAHALGHDLEQSLESLERSLLIDNLSCEDMQRRALAERLVEREDHPQQRIALVVHAAGRLTMLLAVTTLSIFKPWGKTRYGRGEEGARTASCWWSPRSACCISLVVRRATTDDASIALVPP
jgi:hypothetical protein